MMVFLKNSKTDVLRKGVTIMLGCSEVEICAVCRMKDYLKTKLSKLPNDPLFTDKQNVVLSKKAFVTTLKVQLALTGFDPALFSGHSLRAGSATSASNANFQTWEIQLLGRWQSNAYKLYLRNPNVVRTFAKRFVNSE